MKRAFTTKGSLQVERVVQLNEILVMKAQSGEA
jgi:hypothetical protein